MNIGPTIYDIETGPLPWEVMEPLCADTVEKKERGEDGYREACLDKAALSPISGRILAIGLQRPDKPVPIILGNHMSDDDGERRVLSEFWTLASGDFRLAGHWDKWNARAGEPRWIGFNSHDFDLPFIVTRTLILMPDFPFPTWTQENGRWMHRMWLDLRDRWMLGKRLGGPVRGNLDTLCRSLGITGKNGSGAHFAELWNDPAKRRDARAYLENDIAMTTAAAKRLAPELFPA